MRRLCGDMLVSTSGFGDRGASIGGKAGAGRAKFIQEGGMIEIPQGLLHGHGGAGGPLVISTTSEGRLQYEDRMVGHARGHVRFFTVYDTPPCNFFKHNTASQQLSLNLNLTLYSLGHHAEYLLIRTNFFCARRYQSPILHIRFPTYCTMAT